MRSATTHRGYQIKALESRQTPGLSSPIERFQRFRYHPQENPAFDGLQEPADEEVEGWSPTDAKAESSLTGRGAPQ